MKYMITGGNSGLGQVLCQHFSGDSYSRSNGHDIVVDYEKIAQASLDYDVFINNASDNIFGKGWTGFGQTKLLYEVAMLWQTKNKSGHIINIGGVGSEDFSPPFSGWESYNTNKRALKHLSLQWTQAFKSGQVLFRTSLLTVDRLDTPTGRSRPSWTGNGVDSNDIVNLLEVCLNVKPNTCVGEIQAWVNIDYNN